MPNTGTLGQALLPTESSRLTAMNLRAIEGAKATWALENHKTTNDVPTDLDYKSQYPLECQNSLEMSYC
jgi:hypothetical protein